MASLNELALLQEISGEYEPSNTWEHSAAMTAENATYWVERTMELLTRACNDSMTKKGNSRRRKQAYWWTQEIAELRRKALY